jgi:hypothetical protein
VLDDVGTGGVEEQVELVEAGLRVLVVVRGQRDPDGDDPLPDLAGDEAGSEGVGVGRAQGSGSSRRIVAT